MLTDSKQKFHD